MKTILTAFTTALIVLNGAHAAEPSKEQRQKMAEAHQKMADCLKSDRPMSECKKEMMGKDGCPMMVGKHHRHHEEEHEDEND